MTYWYFKNNKLIYTSDGYYMQPEEGVTVVSSEEQADASKIYGLVDGKITIIGEFEPPILN
jgi:hypothetical protein